MDDYPGSLAQGSVLFSDNVDMEVHAGAVTVTADIAAHVKCLSGGSNGGASEKLAAARILTILAAEGLGDAHEVQKCRTEIVASKGHEALLACLKTDPKDLDTTASLVIEAACSAVANLTAQEDSRELVAAAGGIPVLVDLVKGGPPKYGDELLTYACGALGNLAREHEQNQNAIRQAGGIAALVALARSVGIKEDEEEAAKDAKDAEKDDDEDTGLELNASIALRKLAIGNTANYAAMRELLDDTDLRYFLHGEMPPEPSISPRMANV